jgi:hypothetical protein
MATRSASLSDRPLTRPLVVMVMTHTEYLQHQGAVLLNSGVRVSHDTVEHAACTGLLCRLVLDATGRVIDMGRDARCNTDDQRLARIIRDRTCVFGDCDTPAAQCHGHHAEAPWHKGGLTDLDHLGSLCPGHHDLVHHRSWTLTHNPDSSWTATSPDGLQRHRPPPATQTTLDLHDTS